MTAEISPPNSFANKVAVIAIISTCIALVLIPSIIAYIPVERSKWMIASALTLVEENEKDKSPATDENARLQRARSLLKDAETINPAIISNVDYIKVYWKLHKELHQEGIERIASLLSQHDRSEQIDTVNKLTVVLFDRNDFGGIIKLIDTVFPKVEDRDPNINNSWAYAASLAGERLEEADHAIDEALKHESPAAFLDTKAWILHKLGRNEEALILAQQSLQDQQAENAALTQGQLLALDPKLQGIKTLRDNLYNSDPLAEIKPEELLNKLQAISDPADETFKDLRDKLQNPGSVEVPKALQADIVELVKSSSNVLRYHREEIIRALGFSQIADWELAALTKAGLTEADKLR